MIEEKKLLLPTSFEIWLPVKEKVWRFGAHNSILKKVPGKLSRYIVTYKFSSLVFEMQRFSWFKTRHLWMINVVNILKVENGWAQASWMEVKVKYLRERVANAGKWRELGNIVLTPKTKSPQVSLRDFRVEDEKEKQLGLRVWKWSSKRWTLCEKAYLSILDTNVLLRFSMKAGWRKLETSYGLKGFRYLRCLLYFYTSCLCHR